MKRDKTTRWRFPEILLIEPKLYGDDRGAFL